MNSVWQIDGSAVRMLQGNSSDFVRLLNALITASGRAGGMPDAAILLNQADTTPDGGVDAAVSNSIPIAQDPTGWFTVPTCWQFKAQPTSNIKPSSKAPDQKQETALREEINKPYAKVLVKKGYGYRLCIADDMPAATKAKWEKWLNEEARKLSPTSAHAVVVTASDIALWVNRYPAIVLRFQPEAYKLKSLSVWKAEVSSLTPTFVATATWPAVLSSINNHVNFSMKVNTVLTIQGEAGVGKTRSVCEVLSSDRAIEALIAVTSDESAALNFAQAIANDRNTRAILVADECSLQYRERIRQILPSCPDRLRVIAIDNSLKRLGMSGEIRITQMSSSEVLKILDLSFPDLPSDRRRSFAQLARGFVRLAVDLCQHDHLLPQDGRLDGIFAHFEDSYLVSRLNDDELAAVQLVSLLPRVGYRGDVANELKHLCMHPSINRDFRQIVEIAMRLKQSPGFIAFGGRYLYITPTLIAHVAFQSAWARWVAPDPQGFLREFPADLLDGFVEQAKRAPNPELTKEISDFFFSWAAALNPPDLAVEATAIRLVRLVETQQELFLPLLQGLIDRTPSEELQTLHTNTIEGQNARRQLVWLCEKLAHLPEYFERAEKLLLKLSLAESEPHLGNSATRVWTGLFRIMLSGTPIPFADRLNILESRLRGAHGAQLVLAIAAFDEILTDGPVSGLASPPVILGRVPPPVWKPADIAERQACRRAGMTMAARLCSEGGVVGDALKTAVAERLSSLFLAGCFDQVEAIFGQGPLSDSLLAVLTRELEDFTDTFCREHVLTVQRRQPTPDGGEEMVTVEERHPRKVSVELESRIRAWYSRLIPKSLHGRLVAVVGRDSWQQEIAGDRAAWSREMDELAAAFIDSPTEFDRELRWLASTEARSGYHLGQSLGRADSAGALLERVFDAALAGATGVARGYLDQASLSHSSLLDQLNVALDKLQEADARVAFDVLWSAGPQVYKVERVFRMVDAGQLPAEVLRGLEREIYSGQLNQEQFAGAVNRAIAAAEGGNSNAAIAAVKLLYARLHPDRRTSNHDLLSNEAGLELLLRRALSVVVGLVSSESSFWLTLAEDLCSIDAIAGAKFLTKALSNRDYNTRQLAVKGLVNLTSRNPAAVMTALGDMYLHPSEGVWFQFDDHSDLVQVIPEGVVKEWIEQNGLPAARAIARHLLSPNLDNGNPVVPALTEYVLGTFEQDDEVFREFVRGTHAGRVYSGDIAAQHMEDAHVAQQFTSHTLKRVREWALAEIESSRQQADYWKQRDEEDNIH